MERPNNPDSAERNELIDATLDEIREKVLEGIGVTGNEDEDSVIIESALFSYQDREGQFYSLSLDETIAYCKWRMGSQSEDLSDEDKQDYIDLMIYMYAQTNVVRSQDLLELSRASGEQFLKDKGIV